MPPHVFYLDLRHLVIRYHVAALETEGCQNRGTTNEISIAGFCPMPMTIISTHLLTERLLHCLGQVLFYWDDSALEAAPEPGAYLHLKQGSGPHLVHE